MEWIDKINKSIGYIERHLKNEIDYNEIKKIFCCSLPKLQQMFLLTCGIPVSEYIRNRKMTVAAHELIDTDVKIIDLAMQFGYDSPESFSRAYRQFHGMPPSATRKTGKCQEYFRISIQIQVYGGKYKMGGKAIICIDTERLIIRKFVPDDWKDLQEIAISKEKSSFADCDHAWPTDEEGVKGACDYFAREHQFWAVEVKDLCKVVCFINFNFMDDEQTLDIGHVMNSEYLRYDYDYEALKALYNYGFLQLGAKRIQAGWALHDKEKLAPLLKLGMKIVETSMSDRFRPDENGKVTQFEGCRLLVTKEEWITNPAV